MVSVHEKGPTAHVRAREYHLNTPHGSGAMQRPLSSIGFIRSIRSSATLVGRLELSNTLKSHTGCVNTINWNTTGSLLVSGSDDTRICIYDYYQEGKTIHTINSGHSANIFNTKFLPLHDDRIISCAGDGEIRTFHNHKLDHVYECHSGRVKKLATHSNTPHVFLSVAEDATVRLFDVRCHHVCSPRHCDSVLVKARSPIPSNNMDDDNNNNNNDNNNNNNTQRSGKGRAVELYSIATDPMEQHYFVVSGGDPYVRLYDRRTLGGTSPNESPCVKLFCPKTMQGGKDVGTVFEPGGHITGVAYSWNGKEVLASYSGNGVFLFDVKENRTVSFDVNNSSTQRRPQSRESEEGGEEQQSTGGDDKDDEGNVDDDETTNLKWQSADSVREKMDTTHVEDRHNNYFRKFYEGHCNIRTVKEVNFFGAYSEYVMSGSDCGHIFIWDKETTELVNMLPGDKRVVNCLSGHPVDMVLATSGIESNVKIWEPTRNEVNPLSDVEAVTSHNTMSSRGRSSGNAIPVSMLHMLLQQLNARHDNAEEEEEEEAENEDESEEEGGRSVQCRTQ